MTVGLGQVASGTAFGLVRTSEVLLDFNYLVRLARNYSKPGTIATGDLNNDGIVNFADPVLLARNYGKTLSASAPAASGAPGAPASPPTAPAAVRPTLSTVADALPKRMERANVTRAPLASPRLYNMLGTLV